MTLERLAPDAGGLARAAALLRGGQVVAFPTDTVYGLAALWRDEQARARIYEIKRRPHSLPLIPMVADPDQLAALVHVDGRARSFMDHWWPGPLTLVLPTASGTPPTLGVRIPDHPVALALLSEVGEAVATTSANLSGARDAMTADEVARLDGVAAVLDGGRAPGGRPSTVLSLAAPDAEVLREGPIPTRELLLHELSGKFRRFADLEARPTSALYAAISAGLSWRPDVLSLLLDAQPGQRRPNLLLGAVHDLLLGGARDPLADYYPSVGGAREADGQVADLFSRFALRRSDDVRAIIRTRRTQTNEVARCGPLVLGLCRLPGPLALIDVGASAGLNLQLDRYAYQFGEAPRIGPPDTPLTLHCAYEGAQPPPERLPEIVWRRGIDLDPRDPRDPPTARWLEALVWPEHAGRRERLRAALEVASAQPFEVCQGDALTLLPQVARDAPRGPTLVVTHCMTLAYFSEEDRARVTELCRGLGAHELGIEPGRDRHARWVPLTLDGVQLARVDPHSGTITSSGEEIASNPGASSL
ncbi:MAG: threonylcarbamoyl-AMP synthase [Candidatus Dormibacteraeota bacterium]|nr:threonylcarbamoyl-AMP synthase [Candidatus Dormibacteraeota bacterium]